MKEKLNSKFKTIYTINSLFLIIALYILYLILFTENRGDGIFGLMVVFVFMLFASMFIYIITVNLGIKNYKITQDNKNKKVLISMLTILGIPMLIFFVILVIPSLFYRI